jgi:hypothetical protein
MTTASQHTTAQNNCCYAALLAGTHNGYLNYAGGTCGESSSFCCVCHHRTVLCWCHTCPCQCHLQTHMVGAADHSHTTDLRQHIVLAGLRWNSSATGYAAAGICFAIEVYSGCIVNPTAPFVPCRPVPSVPAHQHYMYRQLPGHYILHHQRRMQPAVPGPPVHHTTQGFNNSDMCHRPATALMHPPPPPPPPPFDPPPPGGMAAARASCSLTMLVCIAVARCQPCAASDPFRISASRSGRAACNHPLILIRVLWPCPGSSSLHAPGARS